MMPLIKFAFFLAVATRFCSTGRDLAPIRILVFSDTFSKKHLCSLQSEEVLNVRTIRGMVIGANVTWKQIDNPVQIITEARNPALGAFDVVIVQSDIEVYLTAKAQLRGKAILVLHWSINGVMAETTRRNLPIYECAYPIANHTRVLKEAQMKDTSQSSAIASLISQVKTKNLFIVIQNDRDSGHHFSMSSLDSVNAKFIKYDSVSLATHDTIHRMLTEATNLMRDDDVQCVIVCGEPCVEKVLTEAAFDEKEHAALYHFSKWLIFADRKFRYATQKITKRMFNVAFVSLTDRGDGESCPKKVMKDTIRYILFQMGCTELESSSLTDRFHVIFEMYKVKILKSSIDFTVETIMWHPHGREYAIVSRNASGVMGPDLVFPNMRNGFNNRKLTVATLPAATFVEKKETNGTFNYTGYCIDLLNELSRSLNFSYNITEPADGQWGMLGKGNTWTGLVGMLQKNEVDMVVADLSIDKRREEVMDFTYPFFSSYIAGLMRKPTPEKWKTFLHPFRWQVYIFLLLTFVISASLLVMLEKYIVYRRDKEDEKYGLYNLCETILYTFGAAVFQGSVHEQESIVGRTYISLFWLFCIIIVALYTGNLVAFLSVSKNNPPFTTVKQLVAQDVYKWGFMNGTIYVTLFKNSSHGPFRDVWNGVERFVKDDKSVLSRNKSEHIEKVKNGEYVYIGGLSSFDQLASDNCNLSIMKEKVYPHYYGIGLQNNSPFNKIISERPNRMICSLSGESSSDLYSESSYVWNNLKKELIKQLMLAFADLVGVMKISESGLPKVWTKKWRKKKESCDHESTKAESKPITLIDIQSAFYLMGAGIVISTMFLMVEMFIKRRILSKRPASVSIELKTIRTFNNSRTATS